MQCGMKVVCTGLAWLGLACSLDTFGAEGGSSGTGSTTGPTSPPATTDTTDTTATTVTPTSDADTTATITTTPGTESETTGEPAQPPVLSLGFSQSKQYDFSWAAIPGNELFRIFESVDGLAPFVQIGDDIAGFSTGVSFAMPLHFRRHASYMLRACDGAECRDSSPVAVDAAQVGAVGRIMPAAFDGADSFGYDIAVSDDGDTLVVGSWLEDGGGGINGDESDDSVEGAGAVYVFVRMGKVWIQQAYIKPDTPMMHTYFGWRVALSADGNLLATCARDEEAVYVFSRTGGSWSQTFRLQPDVPGYGDRFAMGLALSADGETLAVGAPEEDSCATAVGGDEQNNSCMGSGAAYVYTRSGDMWTGEVYIKASNTGSADGFGSALALSGDGNTLAVAAYQEDGPGETEPDAGAVYMYERAQGAWTPRGTLTAPNPDTLDYFGFSVALDYDGRTLAVGALQEGGGGTGVDADPMAPEVAASGAVYLFTRTDDVWEPSAYIKAASTSPGDGFGVDVALSPGGETLAVGALGEASAASGVDGEDDDDSVDNSGAAYVFTRTDLSWEQRAYVKASVSFGGQRFGRSVALSANGSTLVVGVDQDSQGGGGVYLY